MADTLRDRVRRLLRGTDPVSAPVWIPLSIGVLVLFVVAPITYLLARSATATVPGGIEALATAVAQTSVEAGAPLPPLELRGPGAMSWSVFGQRVRMRWTGGFRVSDDGRDIVWIEPGQSVHIDDDAWFFSTGVEIKGRADGTVERFYHRNSFERPFEPEGRRYLATALDHAIRRTGLFAAARVGRMLAAGGIGAVTTEIGRLESPYVRRIYYAEILKQATLSPEDTAKLVNEAKASLRNDSELASLLLTVARRPAVSDAMKIAIAGASRGISADYEQRRVLNALITDPLAAPVATAILTAAADLNNDHERATFLMALVGRGVPTAATQAPFFELARGIRSSHEHARVLRALAALPNLPDEVVAEILKNSQVVGQDFERRQVLAASLGRSLTPSQAGGLLESAAGIRSTSERATLLVDFIKRSGVTAETASQFFPLVASINNGYEQRRVLNAVLAQAVVPEAVLAGVLRTAAAIGSAHERTEVLVAIARSRPLAGANRELYLTAADGISSQSEQSRAYAELVRAERTRGK
jgi:hypothetical protein